MPQSLSIAALVLGGVLLLVAITGGKFKIFAAEVDSPVSSKPVRLISGLIGIILVVAALTIRTPAPHEHEKKQGVSSSQSPHSSDAPQIPAASPGQANAEPAPQPTSPMGAAIVFDPPSNIRESASASSNILCSVTEKTTIHILRAEGNWYVTDVCNGKPGYIYRNQVKF